ncbi:MAG: hypothetical protein KF777_01615 [Planctomycetaceae bacterium]|nr:hypothetical protein [Planctomycetaceae bacterium]
MKMLLADSMAIEISAETLRGVDDTFNSVLMREASEPGLVDALLFLLLMAKSERNNPGTIAALMGAMWRYQKPEAEVV